MVKKEIKKLFVLDTNVLIHDPNAIFNFDEHDIVIPITVVEELDRLKSGNESKNISAREASRNLTKLIKKANTTSSIPLGPKKGTLSFFVFEKYPKFSSDGQNSFRNIFLEDCADHRIIAVAYELKDKGENVTLVTKDNNVLIKATALGISAEDYTHDMVKNPDRLTEKICELDPEDLQSPKPADLKLYLNQSVMVRGAKSGEDHIYRWQGKNFKIIKRDEIGDTKIKSKNFEQDFAVDILMDPSLTSVALLGSAGSGKTLLAIACALAQKDNYGRILIGRPAVELGNKSMGFLPGTLDDKYNPYMAPFRSACRFIMDQTQAGMKQNDVVKWMEEHGIEMLPISVIRGDTFHNSFIIIDEAQNLTPTDAKSITSRAGIGTKIVFTGDINQIDVPFLSKESNAISHLIDRFRGENFFAFIEMQKSVRSPLAEAADKLL
ncbi:PhoH family protein [bacterium]|nr:PhoH family protein [bacterium]